MKVRPLVVCLAVLSGCGSKSELGVECQLRVRAAPLNGSDGTSVPIRESELKAGQVVKTSALECDTSWCVRDATVTPNPDGTAAAKGYCSNGCITDSDCAGAPGFSCRELINGLSCLRK